MVLMTSNSFLFLAGLQTILMATFVFTLVILVLSLMLIVARQKLVAQGDVKIIINGNVIGGFTELRKYIDETGFNGTGY